MSEVERDLELVFDVIPMKEELESKLLAEKQCVHTLYSSNHGDLEQKVLLQVPAMLHL